MSESERLVEFELLGQRHKFYTAASEQEMDAVIALVRQLLEPDLNYATGTLPTGKIAILACLNIASSYVKLKKECEEWQRDSSTRITLLNKEIESELFAK